MIETLKAKLQHQRSARLSGAALVIAGLCAAALITNPQSPAKATTFADLAETLKGFSASTAAVSQTGCSKDAAYLANRLIYNNLGIASVAAGYATNTVKWGFNHLDCKSPVDDSCYSFHNTECSFDGCSWFESTFFECTSLLHGRSFRFENVHDHCEVWAGVDSSPKITCHESGLVGHPESTAIAFG
mmetsp:Transcript_46099/g.76185  ORF Transcript_46099/g.76185 Transcript_46099/m.76185 type:complete len:187 (-) Transcript_46099:210-770(-)